MTKRDPKSAELRWTIKRCESREEKNRKKTGMKLHTVPDRLREYICLLLLQRQIKCNSVLSTHYSMVSNILVCLFKYAPTKCWLEGNLLNRATYRKLYSSYRRAENLSTLRVIVVAAATAQSPVAHE